MTLPEHLTDFEGTWTLERRIEDIRGGQVLRGQGQAVLAPDPEGLTYDETLHLQVPGQPAMTATRRYLWRSHPDGIAILFEDGRPFHHLRLGRPRDADHHACDPDSYAVTYDFSTWPGWSAEWTVTGPRKSYCMVTCYRR